MDDLFDRNDDADLYRYLEPKTRMVGRKNIAYRRKPVKPQPSQCHFCAKKLADFARVNNGKKFARKIVFCNTRCFNSYLAANRPLIKIPAGSCLDIAQRAAERLEEIKAEVLFSPPECDKSLVEEEIIYELTFIVEGKEQVTKGERYGYMRQLCAPQRPARL